MKKNYLNSIGLTVALGLLVCWYFFYEKGYKKKQNEAQEKTTQLFHLGKDDIQEITLEKLLADGKTYQTIKLKKTGTEWSVTAPVEDASDVVAVSGLINTLTSAKQERVIEENSKDLTQYGLQLPKFRVMIRKDSTSAPEVVAIGADTPTNSGMYARIGESTTVYRVASSVKFGLDKDLKNFRNKSLWSVSRFDIGELEVTSAKGSTIYKKGDGEKWSLARENLPAKTSEVNKIVNSIVDLKIVDFPSEDSTPAKLAEFGLAKPAVKVSMTENKAKARLSMIIGKVGDKTYVKREDKLPIYLVEKDLIQKIDVDPASTRSYDMAVFSRFDSKRIKLERGKEVLELLKDGTEWSFPPEPSLKVDVAKVDQWITSLQDIKITKYLKGKSGIASPELTVRIFEKKDNQEVEVLTLAFSKPQGTSLTGTRKDLDIPFELKTEDFKKINVEKAFFVKVEKKEEKKEEGNSSIPKEDKKS